MEYVICGSYRRGKQVVNDIDLILIYNDFAQFQRIGTACARVFGTLRGSCSPKLIGPVAGVKFDVKPTLKKRVGAMLLHATGSWEFNRWLRWQAKLLGYTLNQYGLYNTVTTAVILEADSELPFFEKLNCPYFAPEQRQGDFFEGMWNKP